MHVTHWTIEDLKPYATNPRINNHAVECVANSLREFGFRQPIVVDPDGIIICGHTIPQRFESGALTDRISKPILSLSVEMKH